MVVGGGDVWVWCGGEEGRGRDVHEGMEIAVFGEFGGGEGGEVGVCFEVRGGVGVDEAGGGVERVVLGFDGGCGRRGGVFGGFLGDGCFLGSFSLGRLGGRRLSACGGWAFSGAGRGGLACCVRGHDAPPSYLSIKIRLLCSNTCVLRLLRQFC